MNVDQCLFGYENGHRLLASSLTLGEELSLLTELSDLAPGTFFSGSEGYWTGLPVAPLGRYVLMRTWPAPEMSRPGCVWTHALLIEPALLEAIDDLSILQSIVMRPDKATNLARYHKKIEFSVHNTVAVAGYQDSNIINALLYALYGTLKSTIEIQQPGELDAPIFAVWSQQWPRLRRNFRFQTAASREAKIGTAVRFDAIALLASPEKHSAISYSAPPRWLTTAANDVFQGGHGGLRAFLWRYGRDVRRQRGSFRPLTEIHLMDKNETENPNARVLRILDLAFPEAHDALILKKDLIDGLLIPAAQAGLAKKMLEDLGKGKQNLPQPTSEGVRRLATLWPSQAEAIIALLSVTVSIQQDISAEIQSTLLRVTKTDDFWSMSYSQPALQEVMVKDSPEFLLSSERLLDDERIATLIDLVPEDTPGIEGFMDALMCRDNPFLIDAVYKRFSFRAAARVIQLTQNKEGFSSNWMKSLLQRHELLLQDSVFEYVPNTRLLYDIAEKIGWFSPAVFSAGVKPWLCGLIHAKNDIHGEEMEALGSFMLILACHSGGEEGLKTIELFFSHIHKKLMNSKLSSFAANLIYPFFPDTGWLFNWDMAQRFRIIIAEAFIKYRWSPTRYFTLLKGREGQELLERTIAEIPGGHAYKNDNLD